MPHTQSRMSNGAPHSNRSLQYQNKEAREASLDQNENVDGVCYLDADGVPSDTITRVRCTWCSRWIAQDGRFGGSTWNFNKHLHTKKCGENKLRILQARSEEEKILAGAEALIELYQKSINKPLIS